jgi:hypothetical protein
LWECIVPVFDGLNIPAMAWCSISQAIQWIDARRVPLEGFYDSVLPDRTGRPFRAAGNAGKKRLVLQVSAGVLTLRGKPAKGPMEIIFDEQQHPLRVKCVDWGEAETIPADKMMQAGVAGLQEDHGDLIGTDTPSGLPWAYADIEVDFSQLMTLYPTHGAEIVRIGEKPTPIGQPLLRGDPPGDQGPVLLEGARPHE